MNDKLIDIDDPAEDKYCKKLIVVEYSLVAELVLDRELAGEEVVGGGQQQQHFDQERDVLVFRRVLFLLLFLKPLDPRLGLQESSHYRNQCDQSDSLPGFSVRKPWNEVVVHDKREYDSHKGQQHDNDLEGLS